MIIDFYLLTVVRVLTEYSLAILCRSLSCRMTEYSACLPGYSLIIRSMTSSLLNAVRPSHTHRAGLDERKKKLCDRMYNSYRQLITQGALCLCDDVQFPQIELLFVDQVPPFQVYKKNMLLSV